MDGLTKKDILKKLYYLFVIHIHIVIHLCIS